MSAEFKLITRSGSGAAAPRDLLGDAAARRVRAYHSSYPMYRPTPLAAMTETARGHSAVFPCTTF